MSQHPSRRAEAPIGIFDSGFGGLTVARAVIDQLPYEDVVYLGDTARAPYGDQSIADVREFALECLDHLVEQGVKMLVIACNSASAAVLRDARERYAVPVVEVIMPAVRRAVAATRSGQVGVICTTATATSQAYEDAFTAAPHLEVHTVACPRFVGFVEAGTTGGPELLACAEDYLGTLRAQQIDTLILGCTHYPLLTGVISYVLGDTVTLVSSADECAKEVYGTLTRRGLAHDLPRPSDHRFWTTGHPDDFAGIGRRLMGAGLIEAVEQFAATPRPGAAHASARPPRVISVQLTIVGASGSVSGPLSPASCYLVQAPFEGRTFSLLLDLGPGSFGALYRYLDPAELDAVAISHLHPDHCVDLCGLYVAGRYATTSPWRRIPVYGPSGTPARLARAYEVNGAVEPGPSIAEWFDYRIWQAEQIIGPFTVRTCRVAHPVEAYAIRVGEDNAADASLVFTGDTGPTTALTELARGVDLLLSEAAFLTGADNPPDLHLTGADAAAIAAEVDAALLVLTHIPPWHDPEQVLAEARRGTDRPVELAVAGARWTIG